MKYVRQFLIILFISFLGELLKHIIPLSIPASIYGMLLLFLALEFKILKVSDIKETSNFLIEIMPLMFVPAGVGLLDSWGALQPIWIQVVVITLISTVVVMGVSGSITQFVIRKGKKKEEGRGGKGEGKGKKEKGKKVGVGWATTSRNPDVTVRGARLAEEH